MVWLSLLNIALVVCCTGAAIGNLRNREDWRAAVNLTAVALNILVLARTP